MPPLKLGDVDLDAVVRQKLRHFDVALVAVTHDAVKDGRKPPVVGIDAVAEHMHLGAVPAAAQLDAGNDLHSALFALCLCPFDSGGGVMIGHGDRRKPQ